MTRDSSPADLTAAILEEASSWLIELCDGELDGTQRTQFDRWLRRSPEHVQAFLELSAAWEESARLQSRSDVEVRALIERAKADSNVVPLAEMSYGSPASRVHPPLDRLQPGSPPPSAPPPGLAPRAAHRAPRMQSTRFAVAASIVLLACSFIAWMALRADVYATSTGEQRFIVLPDGSTVRLNAQSKVRVDFTKDARRVALVRGQALFQVSKDASRPFVVESGNARVRALGTQFDVYRHGSGVVVTVVEGSVAVTPATPAAWLPTLGAAPPVTLLAGEQVTVEPDKVVHAEHANVANATAWTNRRLVFEGVPLAQVVEEFNRYNVRRLVIVDTALAGVHVRGTFAANDPQPLMQFLRQRFAVSVEETQEEIRIGAKNSARAQ